MDDIAERGRRFTGPLLAGRYRPRVHVGGPGSGSGGLTRVRAWDAAAERLVLLTQVPLPEVLEAELLDEDGPHGPYGADASARPDPGAPSQVRRALHAALEVAGMPDHPRLEQVFDAFTEGDSLWIVSELLAARTLAGILAERPLSPYRAAEVGSDVLGALRAVHAHGMVHQNVTARTVLVCGDGRAVLTGLAAGAAQEALCGPAPGAGDEPPAGLPPGLVPADPRGAGPGLAAERALQARMTSVGAVAERWAPERAGGGPAGPAADLWALGALLFRAMQGRAPHPEEDVTELVRLVRTDPPGYADACGPLRPLIEGLLRTDPAERPGAGELLSVLGGLTSTAPEPGVGLRTVYAPPPDRLPVLRPRAELERRAKRGELEPRRRRAAPARARRPRRLGWTLLAAVLLALVLAVLYAVLVLPPAR